ncbi:MAG: DsbA family protein, partial [Gemmatimonadaceae bacterium]
MAKSQAGKKQAGKNAVRGSANRQFVGALVLVVLAGVAGLGYALSHRGPKVIIVDPNIPAGAPLGHLMGKADAPVQVMEFGDFECPACGDFANVTEPDVRTRLINTGIVAFHYYDFPLSQHKNSFTAHLAAACADDQGKFWQMHDRLYAGQDEWSDLTDPNITDPLSIFRKYAKDLGLDVSTWEKCVTTQKYTAQIKGNQAEGIRRDVEQTPTLFIGNQKVNNVSYDQFKQLVDAALANVAKAKADSARKPAGGKKG